MREFLKFVFTPAGSADASLAIAASRAGSVGIYNAELEAESLRTVAMLDRLATHARGSFGVKLDTIDAVLAAGLRATHGLGWLIVDAELVASHGELLAELRSTGTRVLAEVCTARPLDAATASSIDGILIKGNEAGGFVGEDASFILVQKWLGRLPLPMYLRGGLTPHVAAACAAVGLAGGVLDSQLLLLDEVRLPESLRTLIGNLAGSETVAVGNGEEGEYFRLLVRPALTAARAFVGEGEGMRCDALRTAVRGRILWQEPANGLLPVGQDVCFAAAWRKHYGHLGAVLAAIDQAVATHPGIAAEKRAVADGAPLAKALGTRYPIVQGPMTRVSDTSEFALAIAEGGALPMVAFATMKGEPLERLITKTAELLGERPWGIGLLGFAPQALLDEQLAIAARFSPDYAIIAGGRPDQAVHLESAGVPTFLHVPSANLIPGFLREGARRFIFEGRECGGHIGPLSSFVLWSSMVDRLLAELGPAKVKGEDVDLLFAGGIHDAVSSAMLQVLVAPLAAAGARIGVLMGSAYLFTREIVESGSIVPQFQREVLACERTVNLESGPGHASRCAYTPFARDFFRQREQMRRDRVPADESRHVLDDLILGRLRIASKGSKRDGLNAPLTPLDAAQQRDEGMYMLGQVATLRESITDIEALHAEVTAGAGELLDVAAVVPEAMEEPTFDARPADVAIVGIAALLPKANSVAEYWENIVAKVDAITEIPSHRWDWRLYFDPDPKAKDKVYSKWGGFLDDLAFDPMKYGMPPKSIESVDPMQLMGLEVARRTLIDAGYLEKPFDRERASVIIGASGGAGDFGMQYGLRSELPRFTGELPAEVAARLPEWTEDSFAGILPNVAAGRIANRLNFGGINLTTDAACASSLAAVYQGVTELAAGRSDFVIAGGIDTVQGPFGYLCFSKTTALSPRGRCSTFDAGGDGIVISEGIAMVALKRLADAERDGDRIYAVIKGAGASSDGSSKGMTAPLPAGQLRAMRRAYKMAGFGPATVGLFEAHGTGTVAGDTAELESTTRLVREESVVPRQAVVGSVKTMIGHTKATAGIAGLIKAALALHHRVLPPHRNVTTPNRVLADPESPLYLLDEAAPWLAPAGGGTRRAACSAFGFGGTNFHVVMEEHTGEYRDWLRPAASAARSAELLVWGEETRGALLTRLEEQQAKLASLDELALRDLAASLAARWQAGGETLAIVARTLDDLRGKLVPALAFLRGEAKALPPGVFHGTAAAPDGKVAVLFPGQGSQYPGMGREAALHFPAVADTLAAADAALLEPFETRFGASTLLSQFIFPRGAYDEKAKAAARLRLTSTDIAQPALGAVEVGLFRLMQSFGLEPDMLAGHSYGEFVALHAAGAIDFDALMQLSAARGRFIVDAASAEGSELGTMAAINASRKVVEDAIADIDVIIANHNAPLQSIVSGRRDAVRSACAKLAQAGVEATELPVAAAFHSSLVEPAQQALSEMIEATPWLPVRIPVYSNTSARPHASDVDRVKRQMAEHLVRPVEFVAQIEDMYKDGARVFVEVGPKSVLSRLAARILEGQPHVAVAIDDGSGLAGLLSGMAQLLCAGIRLDLGKLFAGRDCRVGDPLDPAALRRREAVPAHAWMLNGSGSRRVGEPVRQIGLTLEQATSAQSEPRPAPVQATSQAPARPQPVAGPGTPPDGTRGVPPPTVPPAPIAGQRSRLPSRTSGGVRVMDDRRMSSGPADSSVMSEYFATMRQFLETQERVMGSFLGDSGAAMRPAMRHRPTAMALPRMAEVQPLSVMSPSTQAPAATTASAAPVTAPVSAPAAAPMPGPTLVAPAATKAAEPASATRPAEAPTAAKAAAPLTREKLTEMLLGIVEEKTGYPREMVGFDQNLESDLGIDSIKRIEVVGAMLQMLPEAYRGALTEERSKLNTQPTLNGMLDVFSQAKVGGAVAVPFDLAGTGAKVAAPADHPSRLVMQAQAEPVPDDAARRLTPGRFVIARDDAGVAEALAARLLARKVEVEIVTPEQLADEATLVARCAALASSGQPIAGIVHLAAFGSLPVPADGTLVDWRAAILRSDKSLFLMLRSLGPQLAEEAHVVAATGLGGLFGRAGSAEPELRLQAGAVGLLKSFREERPASRVKVVDLDPRRTATDLAGDLIAEIELDGGRQEVGYPAGLRTVFHSVAERVVADPSRQVALRNLVVLATGGARGITAEVLRELAAPGNTLVLTGRSELPLSEPSATAGLASAEALRSHFVAQVRAGALKATPRDIQRLVQQLLGLREIRANLADFKASGAAVEYHAVDAVDEPAIQRLIEDVTKRHGRIDGVVHGAGIIEDRLLADKQSDSWSRVVETKILGLLLLQKHIPPAALRFFTVFSSVAGRYGNSGQSDYAAANETMNRLCTALQARWGERVAVSALCWGPWGATKFGAGMVTAETEAKFAEKGVRLVSASLGRRLFREELARAPGSAVEVICGEAPWDAREAELGEIRRAPAPPEPAELGPLLGRSAVVTKPTGERVVPVRLDPARHLYLGEHMLDGKMVLPAAAALELMAEATQSLWPGWTVVEVREHRLLKGVELDGAARDCSILLSPAPYGSSEGFDVSAALQSALGSGHAMTHYRCVVRLEQVLPEGMAIDRRLHKDRQLSTTQAYGEWLFHGPRFQVIESIDGLSPAGAAARVRASHPSQWLQGRPADGPGWLFDAALLDAAAQMAWLWSRAYRDESALPTRFGRVVRHREQCPERMHMAYERIETAEESLIRANVVFSDEHGDPVLVIEELDSVASAALNRLGGTARTVESTTT